VWDGLAASRDDLSPDVVFQEFELFDVEAKLALDPGALHPENWDEDEAQED
jgi:hypothetical protein